MSRGSIKSDPFAPGNEDTSSISARSDTSIDSYVFDPSFGRYPSPRICYYIFEKQMHLIKLLKSIHSPLVDRLSFWF